MGRRGFLKGLGAGIVGVLAGCTGNTEFNRGDTGQITESTHTAGETAVPSTPAGTDEPSDAVEETTDDSEGLRHLHGIAGQTYPKEPERYYGRRYEWEALGGEWWYEVEIPRALGDYYEERYGRSHNYDRYASDPYGRSHIDLLADELDRIGREKRLSGRQIVDLSVAFVQGLRYTEDRVTTGFDQSTSYPVETLIDRGGDCEDSTILLAAVLRRLGYDCVLLGLFDAEPVHMALGVKGDDSISGTYYEHDGARYYYVETTGEGWQIGDMPDLGGSTEAETVAIGPSPTLVYRYETSVEEAGEVIVDASVWNYGRTVARAPTFHAEFEAETGTAYAGTETELDSLGHEDGTDTRLRLEPPGDRTLRLNTSVFHRNEIHDTDRSEWRRAV